MEYSVRWHKDALSDLKKFDKNLSRQIIDKVKGHLAKDPVGLGKPLKGTFKGMYRYRFGNYRIMYVIKNGELVILIMTIGHRKSIYKSER